MIDAMQPGVSLLEIGNSTAKLMPDGIADGKGPIRRFDDPESLLAALTLLDGTLVCAAIGRRLSDVIVPRLPDTLQVRLLAASDFDAFVADTYDTPETLGLDRILNLCGLDGDGIVISCGTAVTVDAVVAGRPVWGAILPGFRAAAQGLHDRVPTLPLVDISETPRLPARTSRRSVVNGVLLGAAHAARGIALDLVAMFPSEPPSRVTLTGGDAELMSRLWHGGAPAPAVDDLLLFRGMVRAIGSDNRDWFAK